jgi:SPW repeat
MARSAPFAPRNASRRGESKKLGQDRRPEVFTMKQLKHWQDAVNAVLGVWMVLSPWAAGYWDDLAASTNAVLIGLALSAAALGAALAPRAWEEWTEVLLGLWLIVSPWALGFSAFAAAMAVAVATGIVVMGLALWTLATDKDYTGWLRDRATRLMR